MSLRYIIGGVGSGKTFTCIDEIIKKDNAENTLIYIVPEQFSMESEKALLKRKNEGSIINTGVYSFRHLAFNIMSEMGINDNNILNDVGRSMLLKKSLIDVSNKLELYKKSINQKGFTDSLSSTISELMQYNVSSENILNAISNLDESNLKYKLSDIEKIYTYYTEKLKDTYISAENTLDILSNIISKSDMLKNSEIWIDGFKSFTPQEYKVICELLKHCERVNIALTVNCNETDFENIDISDAFFETKSTVKKLSKMAKENNIQIEKPTMLTSNYRHNNKELLSLCSEYLGYNKSVYDDKCEHIKIYNATSKYAEMEFVCSEITKLVRDKNYRYDEIAVIIGSDDYEKPLCNTLNYYNIPNFIDTRRNITSHPLTQTIISIIKIVSENWSISSIFNLLKTSYIDIDENDIFLLENYVLSQNIKGVKKWTAPEWEYGFDSKTYIKESIEEIRDIFLDYVSVFTNEIKRGKKYTVLEISQSIFKFLDEIDVKGTLNKNIEAATKAKDMNTVMADKQIWGLICDVFERMTEFLGNEKVTINEYLKILESGLETATIGVIPALSDHLIVGDIERTRLPEIKALFILGVNEGVLPPQRAEAGILTDIERVTLKTKYFELAPDLAAKLTQDKFNIYMALTKPTDYLYLSYCKGTIRGQSMSKSSVITRICEMFPSIKEISYNQNNDDITAPLPTFNKLIENIKQTETIPDLYKDIYSYYVNTSEYRKHIDSIENILNIYTGDYLSIELASNIYNDTIEMSVSRLESFSKCPYSFFLEYDLAANERPMYKFDYLEAGNIYHAALEYFFNIINNEKIDISTIEDSKIAELSENAINAAVIQAKKQSIVTVPRYTGYLNRMKRTLYNTIKGFSDKAQSDKFRPKEVELTFGSRNGIQPITYNLDNNKTLNLTGKIDRIDHLEDEDKIYVRIIDYKLSEHKIDFNELYHGIDIQLPLYMSTYVKTLNNDYNKQLEPGSILYYQIKNPQLSEEKKNNDKSLMDQLKFRGIILDDKIVIDSSKGQITSPIKFSKSDFENMGNYIDKIIVKCGNEIAKGNISIKPYRYVNGSTINRGCDYCSYRAICKIDLKDSKEKFNTFKKDSKILDKILNKNTSD